MIRLALALCLLVLPARAEEIVADLSQDRISISTNFDGSEILIFGAIKREAPQPADQMLAIIVTVTGPRVDTTVRRKERRLGIWANADAVEVPAAPSFYAVSSSAPLAEVLAEADDRKWRITTPLALTGAVFATDPPLDPDFLDALIRVNTASDKYVTTEQGVSIRGETLFSTNIALPADLTEGNYNVRIFLTRDGRVSDSFDTTIFVQKVGMERWIYTLAHEQPFFYGLLSLFIAIAAGWGASAVFRVFQR